MSSVRRLTAALSSLMLLQLFLLGSGTACALHANGRVHESDAHVMQPRHQHGTTVIAGSVGAGTGIGSRAADTCNADASCEGPWSPGSCASLVSCATIALTPAAMDAAISLVQVRFVGGATTAQPAGPTLAPEPPPPRA